MSLRIRLARAGAKKRPYYRIVVADSKSPRDGRYIEKIGTYDPLLPKGGDRVKLVEDRVKHWLETGESLPAVRAVKVKRIRGTMPRTSAAPAPAKVKARA